MKSEAGADDAARAARQKVDASALLAQEYLATTSLLAQEYLFRSGPDEALSIDERLAAAEETAIGLIATAERAALELVAAAEVVAVAKLENDSRFAAMFREHSAMMLLIDPETAQIVDANPSAAAFYGYSLDQMRTMSMSRINTMSADELAAAFARILSQESGRDHFVTSHRLASGEVRRVEVHTALIGDVLRLMCSIIVDVEESVRAQEELARLSGYSRRLIEACLDPMVAISASGVISDVNAATEKATGVGRDSLIGSDFARYFTDPARARAAYQLAFMHGSVTDYPLAIRNVDGTVAEVLYNASVYHDENGVVVGVFAAARDVSERKRVDAALSAIRGQLEQAQRIAHVGSWTLDNTTGHITWSEELFLMQGLNPADGLPNYAESGRLFTSASSHELSSALTVTLTTGADFELQLEFFRPDGTSGWSLLRGEAVRDSDGIIVGLQGVALDITDRKNAADVLQALATHDGLTGLVNRVALLEEITRALSAGERSGRITSLLMMDLDRFKTVNDTLGHAAGDQLLIAAAARVERVVRGGDLVARLGGDEFVVVMRDLEDPLDAVVAAARLVEAFRAPFSVGGAQLYATASIGVATASGISDSGDLLREADTALYAAKDAGRDRLSVFNADQRSAVTTRLGVESDLRHALERGQLAVWYQPEVDLASGRVTAVEALLRWHHPTGDIWAADRFIEIAEETGWIVDIGEWVMHQACRQGVAFNSMRPDQPFIMRVNASALQLGDAGLLDIVDRALVESGLDPSLLCIEITETALLSQTNTVRVNLAGIHNRGIGIAIDDFGTGYGSLTYLSRYPIDVIKIDRSFVGGASAPDHGRSLLAGILALAQVVGINVTAEGVENWGQATNLREMGCPSAQGWLFSKALPPDELAALVHQTFIHP